MRAPDEAIKLAKKSRGKPDDFSGRWRNELGSTMQLKVRRSQVSGWYKTATSSGGGPLPRHPLSGYVDGNLIAFAVNWKEKAAITAWVGQLTDKHTLFTLWQMTMQVSDPSKEVWESILAGSDTFNRATG
jgi:hypothetical protein